jgi:hypothetical protein
MFIERKVHNTAQFGWYEAGLSLGERRQRGHFSTPPALVDQILDACGYTSQADLRHIRLLDPACGSGNFLAQAILRLCLAGQNMGWDERRTRRLVQSNIWGLDPDPVACLLAEMQARSVVDQTCNFSSTSLRLHIHQADSLALPWQPCVDLLVANPPYLATKNTDLSNYRQTRQRGQTDSYLLFLDLALRAMRPGGWIGLVLPDPVLARANAAPERARLLNECTLQHIWHLSDVFSAEVGAVVLIAQKVQPRPLHQVNWTRTRWKNEQLFYPSDQTVSQLQQVSQALLIQQPSSALRYLLSTEQGQIVERLRYAFVRIQDLESRTDQLIPLEQLVNIKRGEEIGRDNQSLRPLKLLEDGYPVLRGGIDIHQYIKPETSWGIARTAVRKPVERYLTPKLLVVKSTGHLQTVLDTRGHVVLQTLYLLCLRQPDETLDTHYFLLALLNSSLLRAYVYHLHTAYKLVQPQIEQTVLARLPILWGGLDERQEIAERARALERACSMADPVVKWGEHLTSLYEEQERAIRALYVKALSEISDDEGVI